jgi:hypothetical protein
MVAQRLARCYGLLCLATLSYEEKKEGGGAYGWHVLLHEVEDEERR